MLPQVNVVEEVQLISPFLVTQFLFSSVIILGLLYEGKNLAEDHVSL